MDADPQLFAKLLAIIALLAASIEYIEIIWRRAAARRLDDERQRSGEAGLRGLVRIFLADQRG